MYLWFSWLALLILVTNCEEGASRTDLLSGQWVAASIEEEGRPLKVDPKEIQFSFTGNNTYEFRSTLNYREAGRYELQKDYLITRDTLAPGGQEKAVQIVQLSEDSLRLRMMDQEKERIIQMVKMAE